MLGLQGGRILPMPISVRGYFPERVLSDSVVVSDRRRQIQNGFLNRRCQQEQVRDLRHPCSRDSHHPCGVGPVPDLASPDHVIDPMREHQQPRDTRETTHEIRPRGLSVCSPTRREPRFVGSD